MVSEVYLCYFLVKDEYEYVIEHKNSFITADKGVAEEWAQKECDWEDSKYSCTFHYEEFDVHRGVNV